MTEKRHLTAIDLYSGVGGWSLGLRLAGIDVIASYDCWGLANETNFKNNSHQAQTVDIRRLSFEDLPSNIDVVVGSPPCTQFSFSNRGGSGDIADGLQDIVQFFRIVDYLKPQFWAMENVPRVAKIIEAELCPGGTLANFAHLKCKTHVVDMAEFGLPQRRHRCIAGNFDETLLDSYRPFASNNTLGNVIDAMTSDPVVDPLFGITLPGANLTDHAQEDVFTEEEVRINRANKESHTVYNSMRFPDPLDRSVRTITATCTRVSRESIVVAHSDLPNKFRRLTLRERACLQGFPITFQFYGTSYAQKLRMIGNAFPPAFAYTMGQVLQGRQPHHMTPLNKLGSKLTLPKPLPESTLPASSGKFFPNSRTFRFAIPSLHLKSGVRFELKNYLSDGDVGWRLSFYFGHSKAIHSLRMDSSMADFLIHSMTRDMCLKVAPLLDEVKAFVFSADIPNMQAVWAHQGPGGTRPFMMLDIFDEVGLRLNDAIRDHDSEARLLIRDTLLREHGEEGASLPGINKLERNAPKTLAGLLLGASVNPILYDHAHKIGRIKRGQI